MALPFPEPLLVSGRKQGLDVNRRGPFRGPRDGLLGVGADKRHTIIVVRRLGEELAEGSFAWHKRAQGAEVLVTRCDMLEGEGLDLCGNKIGGR